jgi:hypothetical protein
MKFLFLNLPSEKVVDYTLSYQPSKKWFDKCEIIFYEADRFLGVDFHKEPLDTMIVPTNCLSYSERALQVQCEEMQSGGASLIRSTMFLMNAVLCSEMYRHDTDEKTKASRAACLNYSDQIKELFKQQCGEGFAHAVEHSILDRAWGNVLKNNVIEDRYHRDQTSVSPT